MSKKYMYLAAKRFSDGYSDVQAHKRKHLSADFAKEDNSYNYIRCSYCFKRVGLTRRYYLDKLFNGNYNN